MADVEINKATVKLAALQRADNSIVASIFTERGGLDILSASVREALQERETLDNEYVDEVLTSLFHITCIQALTIVSDLDLTARPRAIARIMDAMKRAALDFFPAYIRGDDLK